MKESYDITWEENALRSVRKIFQYLSKKVSATTAAKFRDTVFNCADILMENPERYGFDRVLLENPPRFRSFPIGNYRVVYEFKQGTVYILLVYSVKQDPKKVKKSMP